MRIIKPPKSARVILVDSKDRVVGFKEKRAAHKIPVPLHRAISIVIFDPGRKRMLITKRAAGKLTWPSFWSNAVCSHPQPQESYKQAAKRRLAEELGLETELKEVFRFDYQAALNAVWGEHEHDAVFVGVYTGPVHPDPNEIEGYEWIALDGLKRELRRNPSRFTPWFKIILKKLDVI